MVFLLNNFLRVHDYDYFSMKNFPCEVLDLDRSYLYMIYDCLVMK